MVNSANFVKRLENILEYYSLSATAFAEKMDFNRSTISHLLSGRNKPSLEFVMNLLQKFPEVDMNWLLYGKGSFPSIPENRDSLLSSNQKLITTNKNSVEKETIQNNNNSKDIEKVVIFYDDGSFNVYQN